MKAVVSIEQALHDLFEEIDQEAFDRLVTRLDEDVELADEITGEWLRGKRRVAAYLRASKGVVTNIHSRISAVSARWLTEDLGLATFSAHQHYSLDVLQHDETLTGSALFAVSDNGRSRLLLLHLGTPSMAGRDNEPDESQVADGGALRAPTITLGERLRRRRLEAGFSLRALAERAGVSASLLSQVERGVVEPNLSSLRRIAEGLGVSVGQLVDESSVTDNDEIRITRAANRRRIGLPDSPLRGEFLVPDGERAIEAWIGTLPPTTETHLQPRSSPRDEFILILEGRMRLQHRGVDTWLEPGDAVYIRAGTEHRLASAESAPLRFLSVIPLMKP